MNLAITLNPDIRKSIIQTTEVKISSCRTCQASSSECPVNMTANVLNPLKFVRMAYYGLIDELIHLPELWYCLQCRRCYRVGPMMVNNAALIKFLRNVALARNIVSRTEEFQHRFLIARLHRLRFHKVSYCLEGKNSSSFISDLDQLKNLPPPHLNQPIFLGPSGLDDRFRNSIDNHSGTSTNLLRCLTCRGCSGVCPAGHENDAFNPLIVFRMAALGQKEELLKSPWIWLCLGGENCSETCPQGIKGHLIIKNLQETAIQEGFVPKDFRLRLQHFDNALYPLFFKEVNLLLRSLKE